jgi:hypothetical protein
MLRSTIHLTTCRGRRILVIYYVKNALMIRKISRTSGLSFISSIYMQCAHLKQ